MSAPQIKCRCCGEPIEPKYQPPLLPGKQGFFFLTCETDGCPLVGQTFTTKTYDTVDLTPYMKAKA